MKFIKYFFQSIIVYFFFCIIKLIGLSKSRILFAKVFNSIGPIIKSKNTINNNLGKLFGSYSEDKKKEITYKMWSNYGKLFAEYIFLFKFRKSNSHINVKGESILEDIKKNGRPVIFVSGHFSNFELMSMELTKRQINLATIYRPLNNIFLNPFMEYLRKKYICKNQIKKGISGTKKLLSFFKQKTSIALMIDQRVSQGIKAKLFNDECFTTTIPAQFVKKFKCKIIPVYIERIQGTNFQITIHEPINFSDNETIESITLNLNGLLEKMILKNPEQWIWSHNRWK